MGDNYLNRGLHSFRMCHLSNIGNKFVKRKINACCNRVMNNARIHLLFVELFCRILDLKQQRNHILENLNL